MEQGSGTQVWNKVWNKGLDRGLERRSGSWSGTKGQPANDPYQNILTHCHMKHASSASLDCFGCEVFRISRCGESESGS